MKNLHRKSRYVQSKFCKRARAICNLNENAFVFSQLEVRVHVLYQARNWPSNIILKL